MSRRKRPRFHSPQGGGEEGDEVSSFDSEVGTPSPDPDDMSDALAGRIESLHMENFMCHANLEVNFNKRITFVTGKNGSGKSTIMAALVVVLGGTANTTGRGVGITDFIKKGATWARVTIKLNNVGMNSYMKNVYGKQIIISRTLSNTGSSSYVCKSGFGNIVSKKKEEVDKIITALDLQIKNPICILNQDVARSFLTTADKKMRFSMFMKATHLENIKEMYSNTVDLLSTSKKELETKWMAVDEATREIDQLREKIEYFSSLDKYSGEKKALESEYLWSMVIDEEKNIKDLTLKKGQVEKKAKEYTANQNKAVEAIVSLTPKINELQDQMSLLQRNINHYKMKKKELEGGILTHEGQIQAVYSNLKNLYSRKQRQQSEINSIKENLEKNEELTSQAQLQKSELTNQLKTLKVELSELRIRIETTKRDNDNAMETKLQYTISLENLENELKDLLRYKRILDVRVQRVESMEGNELLKYGPFTPKLLELNEEATRRNQFKKKPVGPCGLHVTLSGDNKWSRAVENLTSGLMTTYCCDNNKDFRVLTSLMDKTCGGKNPPIVISKFLSRYNVEPRKVNVNGLKTVSDVLNINNDVVFNTFIDQVKMEGVLLLDNDTQAASLLSHEQNVPQHLYMGLTAQSDQYHPAPNYRTYSSNTTRALKYFQNPRTSKEILENFKKDIQKLMSAIAGKNVEVAEVKDKLVKVTEFLKKTEDNLSLLKQNERNIEARINRLRNEEESCPVLPTRVVLEDELSGLERNQTELEAKIENGKRNVERLLKMKDEHKRKLDEAVESEKNLVEELSTLESQLEEYKIRLTEENNSRISWSEKIKDIETKLIEMGDHLTIMDSLLEDNIKNASAVHPERIETHRSPDELRKLLERCENYIQAAGRHFDRRDFLVNEYNIKYEKYKEITESVEVLNTVVESLSEIVENRKRDFKVLQNVTSSSVSFNFQACLQTRGYDGQLRFDFNNQTLEMEVIPKDGVARKDTKTLSGGERSYSTVSFILAIWRTVQMPFYFLDEFDVFMDKVNRKVIMDLLLEHAKSEDKKQFIFITPQDISSIQPSDSVSIFKMPDPRK